MIRLDSLNNLLAMLEQQNICYTARREGDHVRADPVCDMDLDEKKGKYKTTHAGKPCYFCVAGSKEAFEKKSHKYMKMRR